MSVAVVAPDQEQVPASNATPEVVNNPPQVKNPMFDVNNPASAVTWRGGGGGRGRGRWHRGSNRGDQLEPTG